MDEGHEAAGEKVKGRGEGIVGAAFEGQNAGTGRGEQGGKDGLQDEGSTAGGADGEAIVAGGDGSGAELQGLGTESGTGDFGAADGFGGFDSGEVLAQESGFLAPGADGLHAKGLAGDEGESQGGAEDLSAAFALGTVDGDHAAQRPTLL